MKVKAAQVGNNEFEAAEAIEQSFKVEKANQEITFGSIYKKTYGDSPFTLVANADSKLQVTFSLVGGSHTVNILSLRGHSVILVHAAFNN